MRAESVRVMIAVGILLGPLPGFAASQQAVDSVWASRRVTFIYQGFTTHYSCYGFRDKIRDMLTKLGARRLVVRPYGCTRLTGVEPFPGVTVTMQVLVPASSQHARNGEPTVSAHWRNVVLMPDNAGLQEQGNCELIEQFKETLLPLFTTHHITYQSNCVPHQLTLGTHLSAEVLIPDSEPTGT